MTHSDRFTPPSISVALAGGVTLGAWGVLAWRSQGEEAMLGGTLATMAVAWAAVIWAMVRASPRDGTSLLVFGIGFRIVAFAAQPVMEDDHYRFLWDGYRFALTGNPYAGAPLESFNDPTVPPAFQEVLNHINHPDLPTIYGPVFEWAFRLSHAVAPGKLWPWKLILFAAEFVVIALLWRGLPVGGRLLLVWCPLAIFETGFNAHPDALAIALLLAAWWFGRRERLVLAGVAVGLALAAKVFALLLAPFVLWRLGRRAWFAAGVAVVTLYLPFWLRGSAADLQGLRAMAVEWEFNSSMHAVVAAVTSPAMARVLCGLIFISVWLAIFRRWSLTSGESLPPGEWIFGAFLLLSAVANPWYCLWLWPFVAVRPSPTGIAALAAVSLAYVTGLNLGDASLGNFGHPVWLRPVEFGAIALVAAWQIGRRKLRP